MTSGSKTHRFDKSLAIGHEMERRLDAHFSDRYAIEPSTQTQERAGIDRWFTPTGTSRRLAVQYKADLMAGRTGNAFIETVGGDRIGLPGWVYSCRADVIVYWVPLKGDVYILRPLQLVERLDHWLDSKPIKTAKNPKYRGYGVLVPLSELREVAERVETLQWDGNLSSKSVPTGSGSSTTRAGK